MPREASLETAIDNENTRRLVEIAKETGAFLRGDFTLTSGKKSSYYFDGKKVNLSAEGLYRVGKAIFDIVDGMKLDAVGGVPVGAYPMAAAVSLVSYLEGKPLPAFIVREEAKEHGTKSKIEGHFKAGFRVAMLEDVCTTGGSVMRVMEAVEAAGGKIAKVIVLVDRLEGGSELIKSRGYDFQALLKITHRP